MRHSPSRGIVLMAIAAPGLELPEEPWELSIVALRVRRPDSEWPDLIGPLWLDGDRQPHISLHPGRTRTDPLLLPGQYPGALCLGRHLGVRPALVQCKPMRYQGGPGEVIEEHGRTDLVRVSADYTFSSANPPRPEPLIISDIVAYEAMLELCHHCASKRGGSFGLVLMEWDSR